MPSLVFSQQGSPLFRHQLRATRTTIGRSDRCDVSLPSETVSRVHCVVEHRGEQWWLSDRSRHGSTVNGESASRHLLAEGDRVEVGAYSLVFTEQEEAPAGAGTVTVRYAAPQEELVDVSELGVATSRVELEVTRGARAGERFPLRQPRVAIGGPGADVALGPELPRAATKIRVVRGRALVEPGEVPAFLEGFRVREITPMLEGEELRVGEHGLTLRVQTEASPEERATFGEMVGRSPNMRRLFGVLARIALHDAPILLTGESGTGKELAARALHESGPRQGAPFVAVNCAAVAMTLFESELFGHEKGAFTGAATRQDGAFQRADGGTLFLDEVGELPIDAQAKLLRALESGEVRRVGGAAPEFPDVRIVAATNRDLIEMVRAGAFREDLYYRLAVLTVRLPSLRERMEDIEPLARALLARNHPGALLSADAAEALSKHRWPGNVRELRNVLTRACVLGGPRITAESLSFQPWAFDAPAAPPPPRPQEARERLELLALLDRCNGNRTHAARTLGVPRSSLLYRLHRLGITD